MSTNISKVVFRVHLPELDGKEPGEVLPYFRERIGEPGDVDEWDGKVTGFTYRNLAYAKANPEDFKAFVQPVRCYSAKKWGVEVVLGIENHDYGRHIGWQPEVLSGHGINLKGVMEGLIKLGFPPIYVSGGKVHAYTWYNGVDEPVTFD